MAGAKEMVVFCKGGENLGDEAGPEFCDARDEANGAFVR